MHRSYSLPSVNFGDVPLAIDVAGALQCRAVGGGALPVVNQAIVLDVFECHVAGVNVRASGGAQADANISHGRIGYAFCNGVFAIAPPGSDSSLNLGWWVGSESGKSGAYQCDDQTWR